MKIDVLIIGAGPCGISCARELAKNNKKVILIEKNSYIGGLSSTITYGDFITDIGPHRFFSKNKKLYILIENLLKEKWIKVNRLTRFYIQGNFFLYPVEIMDTLKKLGFLKSLIILKDYSFQKIKNIILPKKINSFEDKVISDFGRALAQLNMLNYTEKIWGLDCKEISIDWANQRIRDLSLLEVLKKALNLGKNKAKTLVDTFYYPEMGTIGIYENMLKESISNVDLILGAYPISFVLENNEIKKVIIKNKEEEISIEAKEIVSTMPITEIVKLFPPSLSENALNSALKLKFRSHISLFLALNKDFVFKDQWIYLPDKNIPFGRIMEPKNFSLKMSPEGKTSLLIEFFCWENDEIWKSETSDLLKISLKYLKDIFSVKEEDIIFSKSHKEKFAYPVYDLHYKENLKIVKEELNKIKNLQVAGRGGSFKYNNQDHAIEMGILTARNIIENYKKYNIDDIGSENEYFEKGNI